MGIVSLAQKWELAAFTAALAFITLLGPPAFGDTFDVPRATVDSGGGTSTDGIEFEVSGTIGQPDAGQSSDSTFTVKGGFWPAPESGPAEIFSNGFESGDLGAWSTGAREDR